jgi:hypothetical protein
LALRVFALRKSDPRLLVERQPSMARLLDWTFLRNRRWPTSFGLTFVVRASPGRSYTRRTRTSGL